VRRQTRLTAGYGLSAPLTKAVYLEVTSRLDDQQLVIEQLRRSITDVGAQVLPADQAQQLSSTGGPLAALEDYLDEMQSETERNATDLGDPILVTEAGLVVFFRFAVGKHVANNESTFELFKENYARSRAVLLAAIAAIGTGASDLSAG
jgi:hypothetical protein